MNEYEYLVLGRDRMGKLIMLRQRTFDTRDDAIKWAFEQPKRAQPQVVAIVRHPATQWIQGPYPSCSTPALCRDKGYCRRDPACDD